MILVYGSSDDLIEIDGDWQEEFNVYEFPVFLALSDGTLLRVDFDGEWDIWIKRGDGHVTKAYDHNFEQAPDYSDVFYSDAEITHVLCGEVRTQRG